MLVLNAYEQKSYILKHFVKKTFFYNIYQFPSDSFLNKKKYKIEVSLRRDVHKAAAIFKLELLVNGR
jgi:hypothetical protein